MRTGVKAILVALLLATACAATALAAQTTASPDKLTAGYAGVPWGATVPQFNNLRPGILVDGHTKNPEKFFGKNADVVYVPTNTGKWYRMIVFVSDQDRNELKAMFANALGSPQGDGAQWYVDNVRIGFAAGGPIFIEGKVGGSFVGK